MGETHLWGNMKTKIKWVRGRKRKKKETTR